MPLPRCWPKSILSALLRAGLALAVLAAAAGPQTGVPAPPKKPVRRPSSSRLIAPADAARLAGEYLKSKALAWGDTLAVTVAGRSAPILVEKPDHAWREEAWDSCYAVQYPTPEGERALLGWRVVYVSRDGRRVAIPLRE